MDHLLIPQGAEHVITVPYKGIELYDGGEFSTYPKRKKWSSGHIRGENRYGGRKRPAIESFFQTWLYFGCLIEVFKIVGIQVHTEDFIDPKRDVITTKKLPSLFVEWQKRRPKSTPAPECDCRLRDNDCHAEPCLRTLKLGRFSPEYHSILLILNEMDKAISPHCYTNMALGRTGGNVDRAFPDSPLAPEIATSIVVLEHTLRKAIYGIYDIVSGPKALRFKWGNVPLLKQLLWRKWCPMRVVEMMSELDINGQYCLAAAPEPPDADREAHSECIAEECVAKGMDMKTYQMRHAIGKGCIGSACELAVMPNSFFEIIERGGTPIISWAPGTQFQAPCLIVSEYNAEENKKPRYIAISHVWSDGMGNPNENALPKCQISHIQEMVNKVNFIDRQADEQYLGFWIDTLCIPVHEKQRELRKRCIVNMRHIYQSAAAVLVLESSLQSVSADAPILERSLRIYNSKWRRRLWTYQEASLNQEVYYQYDGKSQYVRDLQKERIEEEDALKAQGIYISFIDQLDSAVGGTFAFLSGAILGWIMDGSIDENRWMAFLPMTASFRCRQTTRKSDEVLCLATVLGIDPSPFLDIVADNGRGDQELADLRMQLLLQRYLGQIQPGIIFNIRPRMVTEGYRWAPRSSMGRASNGTSGGGRGNRVDTRAPKVAKVHQWGPKSSDIGLQVSYPGIKLTSTPALGVGIANGKFIVVNEKRASRTRYSVQLMPDNTGDFPAWKSQFQYIMVLDWELSPPDTLNSMAVLGRELSPGGRLCHECVAWVEMEEEPLSKHWSSKSVLSHFKHNSRSVVGRSVGGKKPKDQVIVGKHFTETTWIIV